MIAGHGVASLGGIPFGRSFNFQGAVYLLLPNVISGRVWGVYLSTQREKNGDLASRF